MPFCCYSVRLDCCTLTGKLGSLCLSHLSFPRSHRFHTAWPLLAKSLAPLYCLLPLTPARLMLMPSTTSSRTDSIRVIMLTAAQHMTAAHAQLGADDGALLQACKSLWHLGSMHTSHSCLWHQQPRACSHAGRTQTYSRRDAQWSQAATLQQQTQVQGGTQRS